MKAPVEYYNDSDKWKWWENPTDTFEAIKNEVEWERRDNAPRMESFLSTKNDPYTYGSGNFSRTYYPKPYTKSVCKWCNIVEALTGHTFEACFLNYYKGPRDHLGWHADDSDVLDMNRSICVVSLGSAREIWFREKGSEEIEKLLLDPNSVLVMKAGMQLTHDHRIPKHGAKCGERISLTFRGLK